jgi:hypothetical protein
MPARAFPGRAHPPAPNPYSGSVELPAAGSLPARVAYTGSGSNGHVVGDVFRLQPGADGRAYTIARTGGMTGTENLDAYFYTGGEDGPDQQCGRLDAHDGDDGKETGTICPGSDVAGWAIVVLRSGMHASFTFAY